MRSACHLHYRYKLPRRQKREETTPPARACRAERESVAGAEENDTHKAQITSPPSEELNTSVRYIAHHTYHLCCKQPLRRYVLQRSASCQRQLCAAWDQTKVNVNFTHAQRTCCCPAPPALYSLHLSLPAVRLPLLTPNRIDRIHFNLQADRPHS